MEAVANLQAAVTAIQEQLQGLSITDVSNLSAQVASQQASLASLAAAIPPAVVPRLKPAKPDTYSSVRSSGRPEAWLFTVGTYFAAAGLVDPHTITFVATLMRGSAALWWQSQVRTAISPIATWEAFQQAFLEQFAPVSNVRHARDRLASLCQTKSVAQYTTEFRMLTLQIPTIGDDEQLDRYIRGLKQAVRREVEMREPADLPAAMRLADRADSHLYRTQPAGVSRPAPANGPVPMDIGAVRASGYRVPLPKLTPQERERLVEEDRCFKCRQKGHQARQCRTSNSGASSLREHC